MSSLIRVLPAVALRGMTILPDTVIHFDISREKSIQAVEAAMLNNQEIFLVTQIDMDEEYPGIDGLYEIGTIAEIKQLIKLPNDIVRVLVEGKQRARLQSIDDMKEALYAEVMEFEEDKSLTGLTENELEAMTRCVREIFYQYAGLNPRLSKEIVRQAGDIMELAVLIDFIINNIPLFYEEKQKLLEAVNVLERYDLLTEILTREIDIIRIKNSLQVDIKEKIDKNQKDYILREQLKLIREELGEDNPLDDAKEFEEALAKLKAGKEVKDKIKKEISRFKSVPSSSSESSVIRGYIETLLELPWNKTSKDNKDLKNAAKILDEDHYGMEKVKERVLEFLAVRNLTKKGDSPIICLVGPPGTGKTSIAKSVARALNKEYVRISLGGVRDEAEIRGHRRTYVGAMPGRIVKGLKNAGVKNPLMLLDEIDKVSSDYKGDTASALLEVLDSEQNVRFMDHYIDIPVDLSEVLFIATANSTKDIPRPLLDRMELIEVTSYTENEKVHIATEHLIPKQLEKHGLTSGQLTINKQAVEKMIRAYTKEAGVRGLERKIGEICRKAARQIMEDGKTAIKINSKNLKEYLGKEKYSYILANEKDEIGIVRGLAWTSVGGDTLEIEVNVMPGKGEIKLTGQMGDVMKESAQTGISYIRSINKKYNINEEFFAKNDIHIHIPEGAVPKDGPSAGITMATAILSAVTNIPVRADLAMTGEITLRGRVLPIGGLKEKLLAAKNAKIKTVLVPDKNKADVAEISNEIKRGLEIIFVSSMEEVLELALVK